MQILSISQKKAGAGGMQSVRFVTAGYLAEKLGYNVTILTTNSVQGEELLYPVSKSITVAGIKPVNDNLVSYFFSYKKLLNEYVNEIKPDFIIMCDNGLKGFLLPFILSTKRHLVYERHGSKYIKDVQPDRGILSRIKDTFTYRFMNFCGSYFDRFVTLTQTGAKEWAFANVAVIHNPLWFNTDTLSTVKNKRALVVARHTYEKGFDRLFKVWKEVALQHSDWVLDIYGDNNPEYDVEKLAADYGLTHHVQFHKPVKNITDVYKESSVYLMTSRYEGFGMVLIEAMACGVPCVAFDCPSGPGEIIVDGKNGFLVPDDSIEEFMERVCDLIQDESLRSAMGANAKESSASFSIDVIMQQWDALFRSLAK